MNTRRFLIAVLTGLIMAMVLSMMGACVTDPAHSEEAEAEKAFYSGDRLYEPEWAVVPPRLIGESLGLTSQDVIFDPYGVSAPNDDGVDSKYENPFDDVVLAKTEYYEILGYDSKTYLALPHGGNYYLYACSPQERMSFPVGQDDEALIARFAGTPEQAYLEVFTYVSSFGTKFVVLDILSVNMGNADDLITLIAQYCDQTGTTLLVTSFDTIKEKGYLTFESNDPDSWSFSNGAFISLNNGEIDEDTARIEASARLAPLFGHGDEFHLQKKDGHWAVVGGEPLWVS